MPVSLRTTLSQARHTFGGASAGGAESTREKQGNSTQEKQVRS